MCVGVSYKIVRLIPLSSQVVREGEDVVLACKAGGHPAPRIKWRREDGGAIRQEEGKRLDFTSGRSSLHDAFYDALLLV